jgi:hypothetical protein
MSRRPRRGTRRGRREREGQGTTPRTSTKRAKEEVLADWPLRRPHPPEPAAPLYTVPPTVSDGADSGLAQLEHPDTADDANRPER